MEAKTKKKTEIHKEEITDPKEEVEKLRMECQRLLRNRKELIMAIKKQKLVFVCDKCSKEMEKPRVTIYEGASEIVMGKKSFSVGGQHYCSLNCVLNDIRDTLDPIYNEED